MMMSRKIVAALGMLAAAALGSGAAEAAPFANAYVTTSLNLRAGPSTSYPAVIRMHAGDPVTIYGCLSGWSWCDIDWRGNRGWAAGRYLQVMYQNYRRPITSYGVYLGLPFITFSLDSYWGNYYRHRPFFNQLPRFDKHPPFGSPGGQPPSNPNPPPKPPKEQHNVTPGGNLPNGGNNPPKGGNNPPNGGAGPQGGPKPQGGPGQPGGPACGPGQKLVNGACQ